MKNVTYFTICWFFVRLIVFGIPILFVLDFKNFSDPKTTATLIMLLIYFVSVVAKFFFRNNFGVFDKIIQREIVILISVALFSKNEILILPGLMAIAEYFHFKNEFYTITPSEKWDGNEVIEETEN
jgi:hypothetical protein